MTKRDAEREKERLDRYAGPREHLHNNQFWECMRDHAVECELARPWWKRPWLVNKCIALRSWWLLFRLGVR